MKTFRYNNLRRLTVGYWFLVIGYCPLLFTSCADMLDTDSELVEFESDNTLNHLTDSVYSVMGIINKMQIIADRTQLLGEVRGDLMTTTDAASQDLKNLSAFRLKEQSKYNEVSDYYAVINNCNYYLAHVDTVMQRRGRNVFLPEYAVVKSYRAWTYLQLALAYGEVPLILQPLMTESEAQTALGQTRVNLQTICDTFIADLTPLVGVDLPNYGSVGIWNSENLFIPIKVLLGDLCLWSGRYAEAARWYHEYLADKDEPVQMNTYRSTWPNTSKFEYPSLRYLITSTAEIVSFIPMETRIFDGTVSQINNLYNSTQENRYFYELTPTKAMEDLSVAQIYCIEDKSNTTKTDTLYAPRTGLEKSYYVGDLRLASNVTKTTLGKQNEYSEYNFDQQLIGKVWPDMVPMYRRTMIYLRYAEAMNRAGYPQTAMVVLKHGVCDDNLKNYVDSIERKAAGDLVYFDPTVFKLDDGSGNRLAYGVHSLGSGDSHANPYYELPQPTTALATRRDTIDYQIPLVEDMIIDEMALEGAFEGNRFGGLIRVSMRRNDNAYLADRVSKRSGSVDAALRALLMDSKNWYLPLPE